MNSVVKTFFCALLLLPFVCSADVVEPAYYDTAEYIGDGNWVSNTISSLGFALLVLVLVKLILWIAAPEPEKSENTEDAPSPVIKSRKLLWPSLRNILSLLMYLLWLLMSLIVMLIGGIFL